MADIAGSEGEKPARLDIAGVRNKDESISVVDWQEHGLGRAGMPAPLLQGNSPVVLTLGGLDWVRNSQRERMEPFEERLEFFA